jgi:hypothetical protein
MIIAKRNRNYFLNMPNGVVQEARLGKSDLSKNSIFI